MKIYRVEQDRGKWGNYDFRISHKWGLGGLTCSDCLRTWVNTGLSYPCVDLSSLPNAERYFIHSSLTLNTFKEMKSALQPLLPNDYPIRPGTVFGPINGTAAGRIGDFAFPLPWILIARASTLKQLAERGVRGLLGMPAELKFRQISVPQENFLEIEIIARATMPSNFLAESTTASCLVCGYSKIAIPRRIVLERKSIPSDVDLFRGKELTTYIFSTEYFAQQFESMGLTGLTFEEIELC